jgi:diketogulonate reductase-like aldo/keto reductase
MLAGIGIGYGSTYTSDAQAERDVSVALEAGYRLINACEGYGNERGMGRALRRSGIPRSELTIFGMDDNSKRSSEEPESFDGYKAQIEQICGDLEALGTDYLDAYFIHWPVPRYMENVWRRLNAESWAAMEECVGKGLIRRIGVSNFLPLHIDELMKSATIMPAATQLEIHPQFQQRGTVEYCRKLGMDVTAWSPLMKGAAPKLPLIVELAEKYGRTPAQIVLRWDLQKGIVPVVCSSDPGRIRSNFQIFDFELSDEDIGRIDALESGEHIEVYSYRRQQESLLPPNG